jgi:hypothetical protein
MELEHLVTPKLQLTNGGEGIPATSSVSFDDFDFDWLA